MHIPVYVHTHTHVQNACVYTPVCAYTHNVYMYIYKTASKDQRNGVGNKIKTYLSSVYDDNPLCRQLDKHLIHEGESIGNSKLFKIKPDPPRTSYPYYFQVL